MAYASSWTIVAFFILPKDVNKINYLYKLICVHIVKLHQQYIFTPLMFYIIVSWMFPLKFHSNKFKYYKNQDNLEYQDMFMSYCCSRLLWNISKRNNKIKYYINNSWTKWQNEWAHLGCWFDLILFFFSFYFISIHSNSSELFHSPLFFAASDAVVNHLSPFLSLNKEMLWFDRTLNKTKYKKNEDV